MGIFLTIPIQRRHIMPSPTPATLLLDIRQTDKQIKPPTSLINSLLNFGCVIPLHSLLRLIRIVQMLMVTTAKAQLATIRRSMWAKWMTLNIAAMFVHLARPKRIRGLAVDGIVALDELLLAHAKRDAQDVFDEEEDETCPD